ncbi:MAG: zinc ribbon domain-containing protein [Solobacterium sp.]|nr:zinc ribbon domain-containing protein [Solobacterium sp.]
MFDELKKKSGFEKTMDGVLEGTVNAAKELFKPFNDDVLRHFNEADALITRSLEAIKNGEEELPSHIDVGQPDEMPDIDSHSRYWDRLFDEIVDQKLGAYKVCPKCHAAVDSKNNFCPECGTELSKLPVSRVVCPFCREVNSVLDTTCRKCGKPLPSLISDEQ